MPEHHNTTMTIPHRRFFGRSNVINDQRGSRARHFALRKASSYTGVGSRACLLNIRVAVLAVPHRFTVAGPTRRFRCLAIGLGAAPTLVGRRIL